MRGTATSFCTRLPFVDGACQVCGETLPSDDERLSVVAFVDALIRSLHKFPPLSSEAIAYLSDCGYRTIQGVEELAVRKMRRAMTEIE